MKCKNIYDTLNEESFLKSLGPFREFITDKLNTELIIYKPIIATKVMKNEVWD